MNYVALYFKSPKNKAMLQRQRQIATEYAQRSGVTISKAIIGENSNPIGKLPAAIAAVKKSRGTLLIPEVIKASRSVEFLTMLMDSAVEFVCCDNAAITPSQINTLILHRQQESLARSRQVRDVLAAVKAKGVKLGAAREGHCQGLNWRGWKKGAKNSAAKRSQRAKATYQFIIDKIKDMRDHGDSYELIAQNLTDAGHTTTTGGPFNAATVWRVLKRHSDAA